MVSYELQTEAHDLSEVFSVGLRKHLAPQSHASLHIHSEATRLNPNRKFHVSVCYGNNSVIASGAPSRFCLCKRSSDLSKMTQKICFL